MTELDREDTVLRATTGAFNDVSLLRCVGRRRGQRQTLTMRAGDALMSRGRSENHHDFVSSVTSLFVTILFTLSLLLSFSPFFCRDTENRSGVATADLEARV